ncbi:cupin domain-containing protein [Maribacter sp. SA7]|uniref:cupin domain-containing protein n=1 Tax=Maribacter zhoushanensis TaxID=3030012 RepID=UPI0023ED92A6|nr:cupin domain-containing protein [Maribacter zhoushanensis]MDF4202835.1 cupin domain-containing protein [Maribacter zhoushanensis]
MKKKNITNSAHSKIELGAFKDLTANTFQPNPDFKIEGKRFVKDELGLTGTEMSFNTMLPNTAIPFLHKHKENEEVYIAIKGQGQMILNDTHVDMTEGTVIKVATDTERAIRNNSNELFSYIVIQAKENSLENSTVSDGYGIEKKPNWN